EGNKVAPADSGEFTKFVDLSRPRRAQPMVHWKLADRKSVAVNASDKLPPETLLHSAQFIHEAINHFLLHENVGTTGIMDWDPIEQLVGAVECARHYLPERIVRTVYAPAENDIRIIPHFPKACEVLGVALAIGVEAE